jgi:hypothetical protein
MRDDNGAQAVLIMLGNNIFTCKLLVQTHKEACCFEEKCDPAANVH